MRDDGTSCTAGDVLVLHGAQQGLDHKPALAAIGGTDRGDMILDRIDIEKQGRRHHVEGAALCVGRKFEASELSEHIAAGDCPAETHTRSHDLGEAAEEDHAAFSVEAFERWKGAPFIT